jgi:hypothetical protein
MYLVLVRVPPGSFVTNYSTRLLANRGTFGDYEEYCYFGVSLSLQECTSKSTSNRTMHPVDLARTIQIASCSPDVRLFVSTVWYLVSTVRKANPLILFNTNTQITLPPSGCLVFFSEQIIHYSEYQVVLV